MDVNTESQVITYQKRNSYVCNISLLYKMISYRWLAILLLLFSLPLAAQSQNSYRIKKIAPSNDAVVIDTMTVYWPSLILEDFNGNKVRYKIDTAQNAISFRSKDTIVAKFRVFNMNLHDFHAHKDTAIIYNPNEVLKNPFIYSPDLQANDFFGGSSIKKSGSISRGIALGNKQNLSVNSTMNMQLSGNITPNLKLLASLSDDNIPIQADGNTNKLQEFDKVFIQLYNDNFKLIGGDFWLKPPTGYFMQYHKRAQGITGEYKSYLNDEKTKSWSIYGSGAFSKGKYNRQMVYGVEGNQGPYKLKGAENETFIIVLAGTERVFLNGKLLKRGQEFDYVINYNTAEITFTPRQLINKNSRIIVQFQYTSQNYARSMFTGGAKYESKKFKTWINVYSEQDAKNQSLQQSLTNEQKLMLSNIGDSLNKALVRSIDSVGFSDNKVMYRLVDTLGYDSVLVFSVDKNEAFYAAKFAQVGSGNGNYVLDNFNALGRVYKWVNPVSGIPQGDYAPVTVLITPKKRQMAAAGAEINLGKQFRLFTEVAVSNHDLNTFSKLNNSDNASFGGKAILYSETPLSRDTTNKWKFNTTTKVEYIAKNFTRIQRFRSTEFERNWNILGQQLKGYQFVGNTLMSFERKNRGRIGISGETFAWGKDFVGYKGGLEGKWHQKGFAATWKGSVLGSKGIKESFFTRHKIDLSQEILFFKIGFRDEFELNKFKQKGTLNSSLDNYQLQNSYQFFDWEFYIEQKDSTKNRYRLYYSQRDDKISDSTNQFKKAARAYNVGASFDWLNNRNSQLKTLVNYRVYKILDSTLINAKPENTLLGRIEYNLNVWRGAIRSNTFYQVGSGLELKKEFVYIQVAAGKGVYTWNDYNEDGVKDLNEFETAAYSDQATYIRVFTPSNRYVKTYTNQFSQSLMLQPERVFSGKKGFLKFLSHFSNQTQFRIARKTNEEKKGSVFNPFANDISNTHLMSLNASIRNTFYFNRTNQIFGANYVYNQSNDKTLLANGFNARLTSYHQLNTRWNIARKFTWKNTGEIGKKQNNANYTTGRNYSIEYVMVKPKFTYQPGTAFRISTSLRLEEKINKEVGGGEQADIIDVGFEMRYNQVKKGSLTANFNFVNIRYDGVANNSLGFAMLEALKPGKNYTWSLMYQRNIGKNLQLSIRYNGRKSEKNKAIHSGGVELRAFF